MKTLKISDNIVPMGELKSNLSKYINAIHDNDCPLVITKNGRAACVMISPEEYDEFIYRKELVLSVKRGLSDAESGRTLTTDELKATLEKRRKQRGTP